MACKETVRQSTNYMTFHHTIGCFVRRAQPVEADLSANCGERGMKTNQVTSYQSRKPVRITGTTSCHPGLLAHMFSKEAAIADILFNWRCRAISKLPTPRAKRLRRGGRSRTLREPDRIL